METTNLTPGIFRFLFFNILTNTELYDLILEKVNSAFFQIQFQLFFAKASRIVSQRKSQNSSFGFLQVVTLSKFLSKFSSKFPVDQFDRISAAREVKT